MRIAHRRRPLWAFVASLLVALAAAGCDTGSTVTFEYDIYEFGFELNEAPAEDPCEVDWHLVDLDVDLAGSLPTTTEVTGADIPDLVYEFNNSWYRLESELYTDVEADNTGTIDGAGNWQQDVSVLLSQYSLGGDSQGPGTCGEGVQVCRSLLQLSLNGDHPGGPLSGWGWITIDFCNSPFAGIDSVTVTDLELA